MRLSLSFLIAKQLHNHETSVIEDTVCISSVSFSVSVIYISQCNVMMVCSGSFYFNTFAYHIVSNLSCEF